MTHARDAWAAAAADAAVADAIAAKAERFHGRGGGGGLRKQLSITCQAGCSTLPVTCHWLAFPVCWSDGALCLGMRKNPIRYLKTSTFKGKILSRNSPSHGREWMIRAPCLRRPRGERAV